MRKILKQLCLVFSICMLLTMLATGCTTKDNEVQENTTPEKTAEPAAVETKEQLDPYEVVWYFGGNGTEPNEKLVEEEIGKYLKDKINTTVDIITFPLGEYNQKIMTILQSGEKADLIFSCSWLTTYYEVARNGLVTEITDDMLTKYAPHAKEVLGATPFLEGAKVDGKLYHLACNKEVGRQGGVLLNKALVDKYKFDTKSIKKYADLEPLLQTIKENEPNVYPLGTCANDEVSQLTVCYGNQSAGSALIRYPMNGTKWVSITEIPEIIEIWKVAKKYSDAGYIRKDAISVGDVTPDLKAGKVFATHMQLKPGKDKEFATSTPGIDWVQVGLTDCVVPSGDTTGSMMAIPTTCPKPERALMFYDYFYYDRELLTLMNYGIENVHYVKINDETIDFAPKTENGTKSGWRPPHSIWMVGNQFENYLFKGEDPQKYEKLKKFNAECKGFGESTGFIFDSSKCDNAWSKLSAAGTDIYNLLNLGIAGDVDAAVEKQLKIWNDAGLQEVIAEYNKQFEVFKTKK